jgi:uncharacterized protein (DUF2141 family)
LKKSSRAKAQHLRQAAGADRLLVAAADWPGITPYHSDMTRLRAIEGGFGRVRAARYGRSLIADAGAAAQTQSTLLTWGIIVNHLRKHESLCHIACLGALTLELAGPAGADVAKPPQPADATPSPAPPAVPPAAQAPTAAKPDDSGEIRFQFVALKAIGTVRCALYATPADYMKKSYREAVGTVSGGRALCAFPRIAPGTYSMAAFHDENNNGELDTGIFGIPKEGIAWSNNAKGKLGPAKYKDAAFVYSGGVLAQELTMKYR